MARPTHPERNAAIAADYKAGESLPCIAARYGLSPSRISYIALAQGVRFTGIEQARRIGSQGAANSRTAIVRERISQTVKQRWADGTLRGGRRRLFADDPARREDYLNLRSAMGAAYARQAMGVVA